MHKWIFFLPRNPECRYLASASKDGSVRIWDTLMGRCDKILTSHTQSVTCLKWGGDGLLYSSSQDRTIKVWRSQDVSEAGSPAAAGEGGWTRCVVALSALPGTDCALEDGGAEWVLYPLDLSEPVA